jgi:thymidylate synthase
MNKLDIDYQTLLQDILDNGNKKGDRTGTGTLSVFGRQIRHKMSDGFPLLTTKKMSLKTIVTELIWFLRGETNIKYLVENGCHIWDGDCYKKYLIEDSKILPNMSKEKMTEYGYGLTDKQFIERIKTDDEFAKKWGELGPIYGAQWRGWNRKTTRDEKIIDPGVYDVGIDQIENLINNLKNDPDSRRLMVSAWNVGELDKMTLPPCHYALQLYTRELTPKERIELAGGKIQEKYPALVEQQIKHCDENNVPKRAISLMWNQRSVDTFLGLPFNIASYGLLLEIIAKEVNMVPEELIGNLGDTHLYLNHIEQAKEQIGRELNKEERIAIYSELGLTESQESRNRRFVNNEKFEPTIPTRTREPFELPSLNVDWSGPSIIEKPQYWKSEDFQIQNYQSHPSIKAPLSN